MWPKRGRWYTLTKVGCYYSVVRLCLLNDAHWLLRQHGGQLLHYATLSVLCLLAEYLSCFDRCFLLWGLIDEFGDDAVAGHH